MRGAREALLMEKNICLSLSFFVFNSIHVELCFQITTNVVLLHIWILKWIFVWVYSLIYVIG
jgi:hypothetical protein